MKVAWGAAGAAVLMAAVALGYASPVALVASSAILAAALLAFLLPVRWLVVCWGALLPIWSVGDIPPVAFDIARTAGAAVIFVRLWGQSSPAARPLVARWAAPIVAAAGIVGLVGYGRADAPAITLALTAIAAVVVATLVVTRLLDDPWPLLKGYLAGTTASAVVLLLTAVGLSSLSPQDDPGIARFTGLAPASTRVTYELAIAVVIALVAFAARRGSRLLLLTTAALCVVALLLSGGRGGLVALGVAALVALRWRWLKPVPTLIALGGVVAAVSQLSGAGVAVNTLDRFLSSDPGGESLSLARVQVFQAAVEEIMRHPFTGVGMETFVARYTVLPHVAPLAFAIAGGLLAGLLLVVIVVRMAATVLRRPDEDSPSLWVAYLIMATMLVMTAVEPSGPFVGVETVTLLLVAAGLVLGDRSGVGAEEVQRGVRPVVRRVVVVPAGRHDLGERR